MKSVSGPTENSCQQSLATPGVSRRGITRALVRGAAGVAALGTFSGVSEALTGTGLTGTIKLFQDLSPTKVTASIKFPFSTDQAAAVKGRMWVAFDPYTPSCEVVLATHSSGRRLTFAPPVQTKHYAGSNVVLIEDGTITPQLFGAVFDDAATPPNSIVDNTLAIQAALDAATAVRLAGLPNLRVYFPPGKYGVRNLTLDAEQMLFGAGWDNTILVGISGSVGPMITDNKKPPNNGNAAKIVIRDLTLDGNSIATYSDGINLGYGIPVYPFGWQFGTNGSIQNIFIRDFVGGIGLNLNANACFCYNINIGKCRQGFVGLGNANYLFGLSCAEMTGTDLGLNGHRGGSVDIAGWNIIGLELEAPASDPRGNTPPLYIRRDAAIYSPFLSVGDGYFQKIVEIDNHVQNWGLYDVLYGFQPPKFPAVVPKTVVSGGNIFLSENGTNGTYVGGNASHGSVSGQGSWTNSPPSEILGQKMQSFTLRLINENGTISHAIGTSPAAGVTGNFVDRIANATCKSFTQTPTGDDLTVNFDAGCKISFASPHVLILDTAPQVDANYFGQASIGFNNTGTPLIVTALIAPFTVKNVFQRRLCFFVYNAATGASFSLTSLKSGNFLEIVFTGYLL